MKARKVARNKAAQERKKTKIAAEVQRVKKKRNSPPVNRKKESSMKEGDLKNGDLKNLIGVAKKIGR